MINKKAVLSTVVGGVTAALIVAYLKRNTALFDEG